MPCVHCSAHTSAHMQSCIHPTIHVYTLLYMYRPYYTCIPPTIHVYTLLHTAVHTAPYITLYTAPGTYILTSHRRYGGCKCSAEQCSAVQCSAEGRAEGECSSKDAALCWCLIPYCSSHSPGLQCSAVQCSVVQCSAVQCSTVQCIAVQWIAVDCSAVQCSAVQQQQKIVAHPILFCK
jgi:hypothetical protein